MPIHIEDDAVAALIAELAKRRGISKLAAVKLAVQTELSRSAPTKPLREQFAALRAENPLPAPTGKLADKAFFDRLSDDL